MRKFKRILGILTACFLTVSITMITGGTVKAESSSGYPQCNVKSGGEFSRAAYIKLSFDQKISIADNAGITLTTDGGKTVVDCAMIPNNKSLYIRPTNYLEGNKEYTLQIKKSAISYNVLQEDYKISFTTRKELTVNVGPDGDIPTLENYFGQTIYVPDGFNEQVLYRFEAGTITLLNNQIYDFNKEEQGITLPNGNISFSGGYDKTFTTQDNLKDTIIQNNLNMMYEYNSVERHNFDNSAVKYHFNNITFNSSILADGMPYPTIAKESASSDENGGDQLKPIEISIDKCAFTKITGDSSEHSLFSACAPIDFKALYPTDAHISITNTVINNNDFSKSYCGGIFVLAYGNNKINLYLANNLITNNKGEGFGAFVAAVDNGTALNLNMINNTITKNQSLNGSIFGYPKNDDTKIFTGGGFILGDQSTNVTVNMTNNIIWGNSSPEGQSDLYLYNKELMEIDTSADAGKFDVTLNANDIGKIESSVESKYITKYNNIDPQFVNFKENDFHLSSGSPMIDAGADVELNCDMENNLRPSGKAKKFDVGAYEYQVAINPGQFIISKSPVDVCEGDGHVTLTVQRIGGSDGEATVEFTTLDGTAIAGKDYTSVNGRLTFLDGETTKTITINLIDDKDVENTESFNVKLSNPTGAKLGDRVSAVVNIIDNDTPALTNTGSKVNCNSLLFIGGLLSVIGVYFVKKKD